MSLCVQLTELLGRKVDSQSLPVDSGAVSL